jgi:hypothetical protein
MLQHNLNAGSPDSSLESLAAGWQELARQIRFLGVRGSSVPADDLKNLQVQLARGREAVRALARGESDSTLGLSAAGSQRGVAIRMLQSGCPASDATHPSDSVERAPSRAHVLALAGSDALLPAPEVVALVAARAQTGIVKLRTNRETFTLEFDAGQVAHMHSSVAAEGERLGDILVRLGWLQTQQVESVRSGNLRGRFGEVLLSAGLVTEAQLLAALEMQIHLLVGRLCQSQVLNFSFWQGPLVFARPSLRIALSALMLIPAFDFSNEPKAGP